MKKYFINPEFHRNLWVEFTPLRLLVMPVLLGLGAYAFMKVQGDPFMALTSSCMVAFFVIVVVWGCHTAASTLQDEVRNNVWDFQRISSISPAQYAFGKLFGATSYVWYFGLAVWIIFAIAFFNLTKPPLLPGLHMPDGLKVEDIEIPPGERLRDFIYVSSFMFLAGLVVFDRMPEPVGSLAPEEDLALAGKYRRVPGWCRCCGARLRSSCLSLLRQRRVQGENLFRHLS